MIKGRHEQFETETDAESAGLPTFRCHSDGDNNNLIQLM
jgi:hypothetical protein